MYSDYCRLAIYVSVIVFVGYRSKTLVVSQCIGESELFTINRRGGMKSAVLSPAFSQKIFLVAFLLLNVLIVDSFAQTKPPLVYDVENTGGNYAKPIFPSFDQLPVIRPLPDPFEWYDGSGRDTTFATWEHHRNEIMAAIEKYEIGPKPDSSGLTINASYTPTDSNNGELTVIVTRKKNGRSLKLTSHIHFPSGKGPFPALIAMSMAPSTGVNAGSLPDSIFTNRHIATIDYVHNQVTQYGGNSHSGDPYYQMYPEFTPPPNGNVGQYAAWAWGVSRLIDGLEIAAHKSTNPLPIDVKHLAVTGCSYAGKMALFAGAFDERIALTIAQENGGGGAASWRVSHAIEPQGTVEDIDNTDYSWFAQQMHQFYGDDVYKLPEDHDELMAMIAPRALLETGNTNYTWLSNRSNYISARATQRIYKALGISDRFGFYIDGGHAHCATLPAESPVIAAFVDKFLLGESSVNTNIHVYPSGYDSLDYKRWTRWWGTGVPSFTAVSGVSISPASLDFGNTALGGRQVSRIKVTNNDTTAITISPVTSDNAQFTVTPDSVSLGPLATQTIFVIFKPLVPDSISGNIVITYGKTNSRDTVKVEGVGSESGTAMIETNDSSVTRKGGWADIDDPRASDGRYYRNVDGKPGKSLLELTFTGTQIDLGIIRGPLGGDAEVSIDGSPQGKVSFYRPPSDSTNPDQTGGEDLTFGITKSYSVSQGTHTLRLSVLNDDSANTKRCIDYVDHLVIHQGKPTGAASFTEQTWTTEGTMPQSGISLPDTASQSTVELTGVLEMTAGSSLSLNLVDPNGKRVATSQSITDRMDVIHWTPSIPGIYKFDISNPQAGNTHYTFWMVTTDSSKATLNGIDRIPSDVPKAFSLSQNYPNPFNPTTTIRYHLADNSHVRLTVWNMLGRRIATLVDENQPKGVYQVTFNASRLASGVYFYRLQAGSKMFVKKMMLMK